jgi:1,4-alpha-glucan branching enzyme
MRIYECHVGIATQELKVGTYKEFAQHIIPRIKKQGMQLALIFPACNSLSV